MHTKPLFWPYAALLIELLCVQALMGHFYCICNELRCSVSGPCNLLIILPWHPWDGIIICMYCMAMYVKYVSDHFFVFTVTLGNTCPVLATPFNGLMNCSIRDVGFPSVGDTCSYACNTGYELTGSDTRTCTREGSWRGSETSCKKREYKVNST